MTPNSTEVRLTTDIALLQQLPETDPGAGHARLLARELHSCAHGIPTCCETVCITSGIV
ncbi:MULTISPECIES: hypothetical protein [unclassified Nocardia]|uniref:hypothetical protein n=1 Tax=unclassified Nocardia TaxID=2637762 RepID=UPI001CE421BE|nr:MULTISPECIES: hypothetical protein [unclassified Nocardia]